jgi:hypothetical protein
MNAPILLYGTDIDSALANLRQAASAYIAATEAVLMVVAQLREAPEPDALIVDRKEAARRLGGISTRTVMRLEERGELDPVVIGDRRYITVESIERRLRRIAS